MISSFSSDVVIQESVAGAAVGLGYAVEGILDVLAAAGPGGPAAGRAGDSCAHNEGPSDDVLDG